MANLIFSESRRPLRSETRQRSGREVFLAAITRQIDLLRALKSESRAESTPRFWWWRAEDGVYYVELRYSSILLEFEPGKPSIRAGTSLPDVEHVLLEVHDAVCRGELDGAINGAKARIARKGKPRSRKAAAEAALETAENGQRG